jgi:hypothetical protein
VAIPLFAPWRRASFKKASVAGRKDERFGTELTVKLEGGEGVVRNVSASGIYFVTDVALEEGQPVKFTLDFQNFPSGPISVNCIARIVRVEEQGAGKGVAAAISSFEFHRIPKPGRSSD